MRILPLKEGYVSGREPGGAETIQLSGNSGRRCPNWLLSRSVRWEIAFGPIGYWIFRWVWVEIECKRSAQVGRIMDALA